MKRRTVKAFRLGGGDYAEYEVPSIHEALAHSKETWGKQYDSVERKTVEGGLPMIWPKVSAL